MIRIELASMATLACVATLGLTAGAVCAEDAVVQIEISGRSSVDLLADPDNEVLLIDMAAALGLASGSEVTMTGIGWDVTLTTAGLSWASEAQIYFDDNIAPDDFGLFVAPGIAVDSPVTDMRFLSDFDGNPSNDPDMALLTDFDIENIVLPDGMLRMEFFEDYDDVDGAIDAIWQPGSYVFVQATPAPGALLLLGLAGLTATRRRKK